MIGETPFLLLYILRNRKEKKKWLSMVDSAVPFSMSRMQKYVQVPVLGSFGDKTGLGL